MKITYRLSRNELKQLKDNKSLATAYKTISGKPSLKRDMLLIARIIRKIS